jgi:signal transduction histidine kinase
MPASSVYVPIAFQEVLCHYYMVIMYEGHLSMSLRQSTLLTIGITLLALIAVLYLVLSSIMLDGYRELETQQVQRSIQQAENALERELQELELIAGDWAAWDATRDFVLGTNDEYEAENLVDETFVALRLDVMLFFDLDGSPVYRGAFDLQDGQRVPLSPTFWHYVQEHDHLLHHESPQASQAGLVSLPDQTMLLVAYPISSSTYGPMVGTLIMGRIVSEHEINLLGEQLALDLHAYRWHADQFPPVVQAARSSLAITPTVVQPIDEHTTTGYIMLHDMHDQPALILQVVQPRTVYEQGLASRTYLLIALASVGVVMVVLSLLVTERMVLARLARLSNDVSQIDQQRDLSLRLKNYGTDELGRLATSINQMLGSVDQAHQQQQRASNEAQHSRDLLRTIFDTIDDGLVLLDAQGRVLSANTALATLFSKQPAELYQVPWKRLCRTPVPCCTSNTHTFFPGLWILHALRDGIARQQRVRMLCTNGKTRVFDVRVLPIVLSAEQHSANGVKHSGKQQLVVHLVDVSERLQMEALMAENERFIASQRMTQIIAHEINSPLQTILTSLEIVQHIEEAQRQQFLETAQRELERVGTIVRQLRDLYQEQQPQPAAVNINNLLERVLLLVRGNLSRKQIQLHAALAPDLPPVYGRGDQLMQVFLNLVLNAIDAMEQGGSLCLAANIEPETQTLNIAISDTGIGIDSRARQHIFEPFYTTKPAGSGLGLTVCQQIVTRHGGTIDVQSTPGLGSTFSIQLPLLKELHHDIPYPHCGGRS